MINSLSGIKVELVREYITIIAQKVRKIAMNYSGEFPYGKDADRNRWTTSAHCDWSGGHWIGLLLFASEEFKSGELRKEVNNLLQIVEERTRDKDEFLGFISYYSFANIYERTGEIKYRNLALSSANTLLRMYNVISEMIPLGDQCRVMGTEIKGRTLVGVDNAIIPNILLYWAYRTSRKQEYFNVAKSNINRITECLVRKDGSTGHMLEFDETTGKILRKWNNLGYSENTTWSRGLAWTLLSYAYAFQELQEIRFAELYNRSLNYYLSKCQDYQFVPFYDTEDPSIPRVPKDTTSLSIMADSYAIATQSGLSDGSLLGEIYKNVVSRIDTNLDNEVIFPGGCFDYPRKYLVSADLVFSDYYVYDFLVRIRNMLVLG